MFLRSWLKWTGSLTSHQCRLPRNSAMIPILTSLEGIQYRSLPSSKRTGRASWYRRLRPWSLTGRRDHRSCIGESFAGPCKDYGKNWDSCTKSRLFGQSNLSDLFPSLLTSGNSANSQVSWGIDSEVTWHLCRCSPLMKLRKNGFSESRVPHPIHCSIIFFPMLWWLFWGTGTPRFQRHPNQPSVLRVLFVVREIRLVAVRIKKTHVVLWGQKGRARICLDPRGSYFYNGHNRYIRTDNHNFKKGVPVFTTNWWAAGEFCPILATATYGTTPSGSQHSQKKKLSHLRPRDQSYRDPKAGMSTFEDMHHWSS